MTLMVRVLMVLALAAALSGCGTRPPTMVVVDAKVTDRTADGVVVSFLIAGENPNDDELPLRSVRYSLEIDGEQVFTGERSAESTLRRRGVQTITLPASIPMEAVEPGVRRYRFSATLEYLARGRLPELLFDLGASRPTVHFTDAGEIVLVE